MIFSQATAREAKPRFSDFLQNMSFRLWSAERLGPYSRFVLIDGRLFILLISFIVGLILLFDVHFDNSCTPTPDYGITLRAGVLPFNSSAFEDLDESAAKFLRANTVRSLGRPFSGQIDTPHLINAPVTDCPFGDAWWCEAFYLFQGVNQTDLWSKWYQGSRQSDRMILHETPIYHVHIAQPACRYGKPKTCRIFVFDGPFDSNDQWQVCVGSLEHNQRKSVLIRILLFCYPVLIAVDQSILRHRGVVDNPDSPHVP